MASGVDQNDISKKVLLIEDDFDCGEVISKTLTAEGHSVRWVQTRDLAMVALEAITFDFVILDVQMRGLSIDEFIERNKAKKHRVIIVSAVPDIEAVAKRLGVAHELRKPFEPEELLAMLS